MSEKGDETDISGQTLPPEDKQTVVEQTVVGVRKRESALLKTTAGADPRHAKDCGIGCWENLSKRMYLEPGVNSCRLRAVRLHACGSANKQVATSVFGLGAGFQADQQLLS